ncbi:NUDIX hydrolase [Lewinella sp. IMCC34183]|uniref:NUDIX hydrolase n=1 Tax=Lewinella sp. IMCC34183 TaxID=2248762 RepID=UPI0013002DFA|nr:NUDIX domain-containing protein [Lewinella sp. IMCC34183]
MRVSTASSAAAHTADCAIFAFSEGELRVLLVRRSVEPFAGSWLLPGGAMSQEDTLEETARRVLLELVGVQDISLTQVGTFSDPGRHPVRRVVTTCYYALVRPENHTPTPRGHLSDAAWYRLDDVPPLGFDHDELLRAAHHQLIQHLRERPMVFDLLPERFTLTEAQQLYEGILRERLDRRNFRRKMLSYDFLIETDEKRAGVQGGPLLYRIDSAALRRAEKR